MKIHNPRLSFIYGNDFRPSSILIEISQDSFRLYFRDLRGAFKWHKIFQGDILCDKNLILEFLGHAIAQNLVWTMEHFDIFYENVTSYSFNTPTEEQISYAIANATRTTIQEVGEPGIPFQVFFRPVGEKGCQSGRFRLTTKLY